MTTTQDPIPSDTTALIKALDGMYPERCIGPEENSTDAHRYAAKRELVVWLKDWLKKTEGRAEKDRRRVQHQTT